MIKLISVDMLKTKKGYLDDDIYNKVISYFSKSPSVKNWNSDLYYFKEASSKIIIDFLKSLKIVDIEDSFEPLEFSIQGFNGGEAVSISILSDDITKEQCIDSLRDKIIDNDKFYEELFWNTNNLHEEIEKLIKQEIKPVIIKEIEKMKKIIDSNIENIEWK